MEIHMNIKEAVETYFPKNHKVALTHLKSDIDKLGLINISSENIFPEHFFLSYISNFVNPDFPYLECGTFWKKNLICASLHHGEKDFYGCDNFIMQTGGSSFKIVGTTYFKTKEICMMNVNAANEANKRGGMAHLIIGDWFDLLTDFERYMNGKKIGIYFYDAGHSYEETLLGLRTGAPHVRHDGIILVDDTGHLEDVNIKRNDEPRKAVLDFLAENKGSWKLLRDFDDMISDPENGFSTGMMILGRNE